MGGGSHLLGMNWGRCIWAVRIQRCIQSTSLHLASAGGGDAGARAAVSLAASFQPQSLQPDPHPEQPLTTVNAFDSHEEEQQVHADEVVQDIGEDEDYDVEDQQGLDDIPNYWRLFDQIAMK